MTHAITIFDHLQFPNPTSEQRNALQGMADFCKKENGDDFFILCGAAGTGKTSIVSAFIGYLNALEINYLIAAPTAKAARILGRKSQTLSSTIHSMVYNNMPDKKSGVIHCRRKENRNKLETIYIIDEASMIPSKPDRKEQNLFKIEQSVLHDLVAFVKNGNPRNKVLFLGDRFQLAPIGEEEPQALQADYLENTFQWKGKLSMLTEVKRQTAGSPIMENAIHTRQAMELGRTEAPLSGNRLKDVWKASKLYAQGFKKEGPEYAIGIAASYGMLKVFNDNVRKELMMPGARILEPGDMMIVTTNWKRNGHSLHNGDHVSVKEVVLEKVEEVAGLHFVPVKVVGKKLDGTEEEIEDFLLVESIHAHNGQLGFEVENRLRSMRFPTNRAYAESGFPEHDRYVGALRLNYGYAITCNKAQGGEWERIFLNTFKIPSLRFQYTAVTRAKTELLLY